MIRIGIDVGGTNTDAVLLNGETIVAACKTPTTKDVTGGIRAALAEVLAVSDASPDAVDAVMIGTTHFTNAVVQRRGLSRIAAIRIGLPASASLPPFADWPDDLSPEVRGDVFMLRGGHEVDGRPIVPFDEAGMREVAARIRDHGYEAASVCAIFSPLTGTDEDRATEILQEVCPNLAVTRSHTLGRIGLLERENAALLNAGLCELARRTTAAMRTAMTEVGLEARLFLTQNDGTVMRADVAERFPIFSFASGPTNSMRGAAFLSGLEDAIVADVGGTTTDIGVLRLGFPREANNVVRIGGVRTAFRMPDLLSIGLGGGSMVDVDPLAIGPRSTGYRLTREARVFDGDTLTCTDLAVARGLIRLGDPQAVSDLDPGWLDRAFARIGSMIADAVDRMKVSAEPAPLIAVGGGSFLIPARLGGVSEVVQVPHREVANAVGAAIAQVSGEVDRVFTDVDRDAALATAEALARENALAAGAAPDGIRTVEIEDLPLAYLPGNSLRVRVRVVGDVA